MLVVFNALFQVAAFSLLGYFYLTLLPRWLGLDTQGFEVGIWEVARTVLIFLGIPLTAGFLTRPAKALDEPRGNDSDHATMRGRIRARAGHDQVSALKHGLEA